MARGVSAKGGEEASFMVREEDIINNSRGVVNPSPYGFPKGEGSVSAPPLIVDNHRFLPLHLDGPDKQESCGSSNAPQRALLYIKEE